MIDDKVRRRLKELTENAQEDKIQRYSSVEIDRIKDVEIESSLLSEDYEPGAYQVSVRSSYHFSLIGCQIESSETLTCQIFVQVRFKDKVKNHMKSLKTNFSECYDLFNKGGLSGFAWNPVTKIWIAEPEGW